MEPIFRPSLVLILFFTLFFGTSTLAQQNLPSDESNVTPGKATFESKDKFVIKYRTNAGDVIVVCGTTKEVPLEAKHRFLRHTYCTRSQHIKDSRIEKISGSGGSAHGTSTLNIVEAKGYIDCGVTTGLPGFAAPDDQGNWTGFDVDFCRAMAAAVLGDASKVKFTPTTGKTRFPALQSGEVDVLARNTTWTFSRDTDLGFEFVGINYYDGQGFMVKKDLGVKSALELDGASVCIQTGTTTELNLADYFRANNMSFTPIVIEDNAEARQNYESGACDVYTTDRSGLAATRVVLSNPDEHVVLPEVISKEPLGPLVRHGDSQWADIARWTLNALITAEELGVTQANVGEMASSNNPEIRRLVGAEGNLGEIIGLDADWAKRAISAVGNYSEVYARNLGPDTPIGLSRGVNALWTQGGILYSPPFR